MDTVITRAEHDEFVKRIEDENHRQNHRLKIVEENVTELMKLTSSIERLAINMENMVREQERQGKRLGELESRDGKMWRKVTGYMITTIVGIVVGYVFKNLGF